MGPSPQRVAAGELTQRVRQIGQVLYPYSVDHDGAYPDGSSSTVFFQKLLDEGYVNDPTIFYVPMPGKRPAAAGAKLKPENVSFDVTAGADAHDSRDLPLVYLTGYRVTFAPGASVVPVIKPFPTYGLNSFWSLRWPDNDVRVLPGLAVYYLGNNAKWIAALRFVPAAPGTFPTTPGMQVLVVPAGSGKTVPLNPGWDVPPTYDGSIHDFVPASFDAKGKTFRQLTPEGVLNAEGER